MSNCAMGIPNLKIGCPMCYKIWCLSNTKLTSQVENPIPWDISCVRSWKILHEITFILSTCEAWVVFPKISLWSPESPVVRYWYIKKDELLVIITTAHIIVHIYMDHLLEMASWYIQDTQETYDMWGCIVHFILCW